jgi:hypothetical protein
MQGGCYCGTIRYEAEGAFGATLCHCADCRGTAGAPAVAWFTVPRAAFRFTRGEPTRFRSSAACERSFCPVCGTQLTFGSDRSPTEIDVTTCSLDDPELVPPGDHVWTRSRLSWAPICDGLPTHTQGRQPPAAGG